MGRLLEEYLPPLKEDGINTEQDITTTGNVSVTGNINSRPTTLSSSQLTTVDTSPTWTVGTRGRDANGNEYIYLLGVASTVANDFVTFNSATFATTRLVGTAVGPVAVAMAATVASRYGWYLVYGNGTGNNGNVVSAGALYASSVTAACDDLAVSGDRLYGAFATGTQSVTGGGVAIMLDYPFIDQGTI